MDIDVCLTAHQKYRPAWATGDDNGASIHSPVNEYLALDTDGNIVLRLPVAP